MSIFTYRFYCCYLMAVIFKYENKLFYLNLNVYFALTLSEWGLVNLNVKRDIWVGRVKFKRKVKISIRLNKD